MEGALLNNIRTHVAILKEIILPNISFKDIQEKIEEKELQERGIIIDFIDEINKIIGKNYSSKKNNILFSNLRECIEDLEKYLDDKDKVKNDEILENLENNLCNFIEEAEKGEFDDIIKEEEIEKVKEKIRERNIQTAIVKTFMQAEDERERQIEEAKLETNRMKPHEESLTPGHSKKAETKLDEVCIDPQEVVEKESPYDEIYNTIRKDQIIEVIKSKLKEDKENEEILQLIDIEIPKTKEEKINEEVDVSGPTKRIEKIIEENDKLDDNKKFLLLSKLNECYEYFESYASDINDNNRKMKDIKKGIVKNLEINLNDNQKEKAKEIASEQILDLVEEIKILSGYGDLNKENNEKKITEVIYEKFKNRFNFDNKTKEEEKLKDIIFNNNKEGLKQLINIETTKEIAEFEKIIENKKDIIDSLKGKGIIISNNVEGLLELRKKIKKENKAQKWLRQLKEVNKEGEILRNNKATLSERFKWFIKSVKTFFGGRLKKDYNKNQNFARFSSYVAKKGGESKLEVDKKEKFKVKNIRGELENLKGELKNLEEENNDLKFKNEITDFCIKNIGKIKNIIAKVIKENKSKSPSMLEIKKEIAVKILDIHNKKRKLPASRRDIFDNTDKDINFITESILKGEINSYIVNKSARTEKREMISVKASNDSFKKKENQRRNKTEERERK